MSKQNKYLFKMIIGFSIIMIWTSVIAVTFVFGMSWIIDQAPDKVTGFATALGCMLLEIIVALIIVYHVPTWGNRERKELDDDEVDSLTRKAIIVSSFILAIIITLAFKEYYM